MDGVDAELGQQREDAALDLVADGSDVDDVERRVLALMAELDIPVTNPTNPAGVASKGATA